MQNFTKIRTKKQRMRKTLTKQNRQAEYRKQMDKQRRRRVKRQLTAESQFREKNKAG